MKLILRNSSFEVVTESDRDLLVVKRFLKGLTTYQRSRQNGKTRWIVKDEYFAHIVRSNTYILNNGELESFIFHIRINGYEGDALIISNEKFSVDYKLDVKYISKFKPRDEQAMFIDGMVSNDTNTKLVEARTGYGKTFMTAKVIDILRCRTMFYIRSTYIPKWRRDIMQYFDVTKDNIYEVSGSKSLEKLFKLNTKDIPPFIICSNSTMREYFYSYMNGITSSYAIDPQDFMKELQIGLMVSDESHQFFHNLYIAVTLLNPPKLIGLSATLISKDKKIEKMYYSLFPDETRLGLKVYKKFTHFVFISYRFDRMPRNSGDGLYGYNHIQYEQTIARDRNKLKNYIEMIKFYVDEFYVTGGHEGDKLLIYAKGLEMIAAITEFMVAEYPDLDVREYIKGSPESNVLESDIRISHPDKSGAAVDIPNLVTVINTINVDSPAQYLQMSGRLREIDGRDVKFIQLFCSNIPKHKGYIISNLRFIDSMSKSIVWDRYHKLL